ncbi:phosphoribosyltransferase [Pontibacter anaerobius]|uniref:Phosphoribosyltransferase family protein n=1 Tax=Pontibacter anaerobius TaxID=2993940 RepID=A0ABT3RCI3_9BACT|nr:phosphoribosyltransferase family protein [Pontibacter anaerobius]MCX2739475.1 phosphoribosyltransferase family protein [Pontibacter anaerobius]
MDMIRNRAEAAELLAERLQKYKGEQGVVLAIPRGGVPVAAPIAKKLGMPLEVTVSKKIGHPLNPEFAIGAVSMDSVSYDKRADVPENYIEAEVQRIRQGMQQKYKRFMGNRQHIPFKDRVVIIVDDGIATGKTLEATVNLVKKEHPRKIVVAVPVAPPEAADRFSGMVDDFVCLLTPPFFQAVGQFYEEFTQTSDEEVIQLLQDQDKV